MAARKIGAVEYCNKKFVSNENRHSCYHCCFHCCYYYHCCCCCHHRRFHYLYHFLFVPLLLKVLLLTLPLMPLHHSMILRCRCITDSLWKLDYKSELEMHFDSCNEFHSI